MGREQKWGEKVELYLSHEKKKIESSSGKKQKVIDNEIDKERLRSEARLQGMKEERDKERGFMEA